MSINIQNESINQNTDNKILKTNEQNEKNDIENTKTSIISKEGDINKDKNTPNNIIEQTEENENSDEIEDTKEVEEEEEKEDSINKNNEEQSDNSSYISEDCKNQIRIKTNSIKRAEKEIEEMFDRITQLKENLINSKKGPCLKEVRLTEREIITTIERAYPILKNEPSMLELEPPIYICGDIHGQFYDLLRVFEIIKYPPETKILFLGDYVDRGKKSLECILLLLCLKIKYPDKIFILRGNHETQDINRQYGFYDECKRRVSLKIYKKFCDLFNILPLTALVGEKILCMHGGLSPLLSEIDDLKKIKRPTEIQEGSLECDLIWSDPEQDMFLEFCNNEDRGISCCFSEKAVENFNNKNDIDLICRAHQVVEEGYQFFSNMKLITVFTAPNYMGEFDNNGGILKVNEDLLCSIIVIKPIIDKNDMKKRRKILQKYIN